MTRIILYLRYQLYPFINTGDQRRRLLIYKSKSYYEKQSFAGFNLSYP